MRDSSHGAPRARCIATLARRLLASYRVGNWRTPGDLAHARFADGSPDRLAVDAVVGSNEFTRIRVRQL